MKLSFLASAFILVMVSGCDARSVGSLPAGSHTEGGYGSWFYAEVMKPTGEGKKPRILLFTSVAAFDKYVEKGEMAETGHKKFIGAGKGGETLVVDTTGALEAKDLVRRYRERHDMAN